MKTVTIRSRETFQAIEHDGDLGRLYDFLGRESSQWLINVPVGAIVVSDGCIYRWLSKEDFNENFEIAWGAF